MDVTRRYFVLAAVVAASLSALVSSASAQGAGGNQAFQLKVRVYRDGTWLGGNAQWIAGATVQIRNQSTGQLQFAVTNPSGVATFTQMQKSKRYEIRVAAGGWLPAERIHLQGAYDQVVNIALKPANPPPGRRLEIRAFRYGTYSGGNAEWLSGVSVRVTKSGTGEIMGERTTYASGSAYFLDLQPGIYRVTLYKRGFQQLTRHIRVENSNKRVSLAMMPN